MLLILYNLFTSSLLLFSQFNPIFRSKSLFQYFLLPYIQFVIFPSAHKLPFTFFGCHWSRHCFIYSAIVFLEIYFTILASISVVDAHPNRRIPAPILPLFPFTNSFHSVHFRVLVLGVFFSNNKSLPYWE